MGERLGDFIESLWMENPSIGKSYKYFALLFLLCKTLYPGIAVS